MKETESTRPSEIGLKEAIQQHLYQTITSNDSFLVYYIARPADLGFPARTDTEEVDDPREPYRKLREEGKRLGKESRIDLRDGRKLVTFDTVAASSHTQLVVPYKDFETEHRANHSCISGEPLIVGTGPNNTPEYVPLDYITWTLLVDENDDVIGPVDIADLVGTSGNLEGVMPEVQETLAMYQLGLQEEDKEQLRHYYKQLQIRLESNNMTILSMYNKYIKPNLPMMPDLTYEDIAHYMGTGYNRGDDVKMLGQSEYDGTGHGPQSNPTFHMRSILNIYPEQWSALSSEERHAIEESEYFQGNIETQYMLDITRDEDGYVEDLLPNPAMVTPAMIEKILKQIDPYSYVVDQCMGQWFNVYADKITGRQVKTERYSKYSDASEVHFKAGEGVELQAPPHMPFKEVMSRANILIGKMYDFWRDARSAIRTYHYEYLIDGNEQSRAFEYLNKNYNLDSNIIGLLQQIKPTQKQLNNWLKDVQDQLLYDQNNEGLRNAETVLSDSIESYNNRQKIVRQEMAALEEKIGRGEGSLDDLTEFLYLKLTSQIYEPTEGDESLNMGYNAPGVPGFGINYHRENDGSYRIDISWLLSKKGLVELIFGMIVDRAEGKGATNPHN